jgi:hypothetical protein
MRVPRKATLGRSYVTVPKSNTRGWMENIQVDGITKLKELCKIAVVTSG